MLTPVGYASASIVLLVLAVFRTPSVQIHGFVMRKPLEYLPKCSSDVASSFVRPVATSLWKVPRSKRDPTETQPPNKRKTKKNKYAQFSKADKVELDPFEALMKESEEKLQSLENAKRAKQQEKDSLPAPPEGSTTPLQFPNNKDIDPYDPTTFGFVEIGSIVGPHGVHGWVKVQGSTDFPERLTRPGMPLHMKAPRKRAPRKATLAAGKFLGNDQFLVQLQGYYNRTASETLKGSTLYYATQQDSVAREDDEIILSELIGLSVYKSTEQGEDDVLVGTILGVVLAEEMCAVPGLLHDQIEVGVTRTVNGNREAQGAPQEYLLIPLVPEIIPKIDLEAQMILVDPPSGLLDLTYMKEEKVKIKGLLAPAKEG